MVDNLLTLFVDKSEFNLSLSELFTKAWRHLEICGLGLSPTAFMAYQNNFKTD